MKRYTRFPSGSLRKVGRSESEAMLLANSKGVSPNVTAEIKRAIWSSLTQIQFCVFSLTVFRLRQRLKFHGEDLEKWLNDASTNTSFHQIASTSNHDSACTVQTRHDARAGVLS